MEFELTLHLDENETKHIKVRYGTALRAALTENGISGNPCNIYGRPVPDSMPLRGPADFKITQSTQST
jgi:hypothetical protein